MQLYGRPGEDGGASHRDGVALGVASVGVQGGDGVALAQEAAQVHLGHVRHRHARRPLEHLVQVVRQLLVDRLDERQKLLDLSGENGQVTMIRIYALK